MEFNRRNLIVSDSLEGIFSDELNSYVTHAFCTEGSCHVVYNGEEMTLAEDGVMILLANRLVTACEPSKDFRAKVIYIHPTFMEICTPHTSYGVVGGLSLYINPIMQLSEADRKLCEHDFDDVIRRSEIPYSGFHGDIMISVTQTMFIDFYEFHTHLYGNMQVSALTASVMRRFIDMLQRGDYRSHRDVAYYADKLCVTPKYLSEVCKKSSGFSANFWIDRFTVIELVQMLRDKRLTLTEIADRFNFSSQSHFSRFVQKNLGQSPGSFRG